MRRFPVVAGVVILLAGMLWPWISKLGLGRLPGDIRFEKAGFGFYFPITTGLILSIVLSGLLWLFRK
ncbi:MAG: DUF2905 domain-containing protein [Burkholderiales bacterium]